MRRERGRLSVATGLDWVPWLGRGRRFSPASAVAERMFGAATRAARKLVVRGESVARAGAALAVGARFPPPRDKLAAEGQEPRWMCARGQCQGLELACPSVVFDTRREVVAQGSAGLGLDSGCVRVAGRCVPQWPVPA